MLCITLPADSQRYRTDINPLMKPSGLDSLFEEGESLLVCTVSVTETKTSHSRDGKHRFHTIEFSLCSAVTSNHHSVEENEKRQIRVLTIAGNL